MRKSHKTLLVPLIVTVILASVIISFAQEQISITTYYPAPFGVYKDLSVTNQLKIMNFTTGWSPGNGPGIWFVPPNGNNANPAQIATYNLGGGEQGLSILFYTPGTTNDYVRIGQQAGGQFRGLFLRGDDMAIFSGGVTINHDLWIVLPGTTLHVNQLNISRISQGPIPGGTLSDPVSESYVGVPNFFQKMPYRNKAHL